MIAARNTPSRLRNGIQPIRTIFLSINHSITNPHRVYTYHLEVIFKRNDWEKNEFSLCFCQTSLCQIVKPGFHYPSWRPELTARVDGRPVSITRQHGPCWRARVSTSRVDVIDIAIFCKYRINIVSKLKKWYRSITSGRRRQDASRRRRQKRRRRKVGVIVNADVRLGADNDTTQSSQ